MESNDCSEIPDRGRHQKLPGYLRVKRWIIKVKVTVSIHHKMLLDVPYIIANCWTFSYLTWYTAASLSLGCHLKVKVITKVRVQEWFVHIICFWTAEPFCAIKLGMSVHHYQATCHGDSWACLFVYFGKIEGWGRREGLNPCGSGILWTVGYFVITLCILVQHNQSAKQVSLYWQRC